MAPPHLLLAKSLAVLVDLQKCDGRVIRGRDLPRLDRQRLVRAGYLRQVVRGWYLPASPDTRVDSAADWLAGMWEFVSGYCCERFGEDWHVSPEQSLLLRTGVRTLPKQVQIWAPGANNQTVALPHGYSLFLYRAPRLWVSEAVVDVGGLRLITQSQALVAAGPTFFTQHPLTARIALGSVQDTSELLRPLLEGGHVHIAGRLAGGMRDVGRTDVATNLLDAMAAAGLDVKLVSPFALPLPTWPRVHRAEQAYAIRMRLMWSQMREDVVIEFSKPGTKKRHVRSTLDEIEEHFVTDAYNSLSIEGYKVTPALLKDVGSDRDDVNVAGLKNSDVAAALEYREAFLQVKDYIASTLASRPKRWQMKDALADWYRALFRLSVQRGELKPSALAGWRKEQVFIRGALHMPPSMERVRECMPVFFELLAEESDAAVRAVLGHFFFSYVHPYMDGNGRLARFLFNAMLVTGGYNWTTIPFARRAAYMSALERASSYEDIRPLARFLAELNRAQSSTVGAVLSNQTSRRK